MDTSSETQLQQLLRLHFRKIVGSLKDLNVYCVADILWSAWKINSGELEAIRKCDTSNKAATELLDVVYRRGDDCIMALAIAFVDNDVNMPNLAKMLSLEPVNTAITAARASDEGLVRKAHFAEVTTERVLLSINLRQVCHYVANRLTEGEVADITNVLHFKYMVLTVRDREHIRATYGSYCKAVLLLDILTTKGDRAIVCFAKSLQKIFRPELVRTLYGAPLGSYKDAQTADAAFFRRTAGAAGVHSVQTMRNIITLAESVGAICLSSGPMVGTGFCVGTLEHTYVMTSYHCYETFKGDLAAGIVEISFQDSYVAYTSSFVLKRYIAGDNTLDYAILELKTPTKAPPPISCCTTDFETLVRKESHSVRYITAVGYCSTVRTVDVAVEWLSPSKSVVDMVKDAVVQQWPQYQPFIADYDRILDVDKDYLFYHASCHKLGSAGSPVFLCKSDHGAELVALHSRGFPAFYYQNVEADRVIPDKYTLEAGTRMSVICRDLRSKDVQLCQRIFQKIA